MTNLEKAELESWINGIGEAVSVFEDLLADNLRYRLTEEARRKMEEEHFDNLADEYFGK